MVSQSCCPSSNLKSLTSQTNSSEPTGVPSTFTPLGSTLLDPGTQSPEGTHQRCSNNVSFPCAKMNIRHIQQLLSDDVVEESCPSRRTQYVDVIQKSEQFLTIHHLHLASSSALWMESLNKKGISGHPLLPSFVLLDFVCGVLIHRGTDTGSVGNTQHAQEATSAGAQELTSTSSKWKFGTRESRLRPHGSREEWRSGPFL